MFERGGEGRSGGEGERAERDKGGGASLFDEAFTRVLLKHFTIRYK